MPIHDVGYRNWDGQRTSQWSRWMVISQTGIRLCAKSAWVRRILLASWLPVMYWGFGFFILEKTIKEQTNPILSTATSQFDELEGIVNEELENVADQVPDVVPKVIIDQAKSKAQEAIRKGRKDLEKSGGLEKAIEKGRQEIVDQAKKNNLKNIAGFDEATQVETLIEDRFSMFPHSDALFSAIKTGDPERIRKDVWRWMLMVFFRYPQSLLILFLIGIVAPSLISRDLRSRAFLLYFSRPIGKLEYIFGKLCIPAVFIAAVTTLPALALYLFAIMMSPNLGVFWSTWDIPIRIIVATFALVIPTSSLALMLSSLTHESRFANFSWFAVWALGHGAWMAIVLATAIGMREEPFSQQVMESAQVQNWSVLSLYNCLGDVQEFIFGFESLENIWRGAGTIFFITAFSLWVLYRRVSAPVQV